MTNKSIQHDEYQQFIKTVKTKIQSAQIKAAVSVNIELLKLYWFLGSEVVEKQKKSHWGDGLIKQLSMDLKKEFPEMKGFSYRNVKYMKQWFLFWSPVEAIGQQAVAQLEPSLILQIPWGQNLVIISKSQSKGEALFYVQQTIENN